MVGALLRVVLLLAVGVLVAAPTTYAVRGQPRPESHDRSAALDDSVEQLSSPAPEDVPMYRGNPERTGAMPGPDPQGQIGELWRVEAGQEIWSSPVVANGVVYVGAGKADDRRGFVLALDAKTGNEIWKFEAGSYWSTPAISNDLLYAADLDGFLVVLDALDGKFNTRIRLGTGMRCSTGSSPVVHGGMVFVGVGCLGPEDIGDSVSWADLTGHLVAFDAQSNSVAWRFAMDGFSPNVSPAISKGIVVLADDKENVSSDGTVYAIDANSGTELWRFVANTGIVSTPAIDNGLVLAVGRNGVLFALDLESGLERWRFTLGRSASRSPAAGNGVVYAVSNEGSLYAIDATTGIEVWRATPGNNSASSPVFTEDTVFISQRAGYINRIDRNAGKAADTRIAAVQVRQAVESSLAVSQGTIYVTTTSGGILALGDIRATVPIKQGMTVEVTGDTVPIHAAPSTGAVNRGEAESGTKLRVTAGSETRGGVVWWPVEAAGIGAGWVPESAIVAAQLPPTLTATNLPTMATPTPTSTVQISEPNSDSLDVEGNQEGSLEGCRNPFENIPEDMRPEGFPFDECDSSGLSSTPTPEAIVAAEATIAAYSTREVLLNRQATATAAAEATVEAMSAEKRATESAWATSEVLAAEATIATYATREIVADQNLDEIAQEAAQVAALATGAAISAQATISVLTARESAMATEIAALQAQRDLAEGTASPLETAQAEITAQGTIISAQATEGVAVAGIATQNAASGADALATAQAEAAARATEVAALQGQQADAQVTATALAVVAAGSVLDPAQQSLAVQTDLAGVLAGDEEALEAVRADLSTQLSRYPIGCRAGFLLISGTAPSIEQGIELAERVEALLRQFWPDIFTEATGAEQFALPNVQPFGEVNVDIFFYSGCEPIG